MLTLKFSGCCLPLTLKHPVTSTRPRPTLLLPLGRSPGPRPSHCLSCPTPAAPSQPLPHNPRNQTKTSPCLDPNQGPIGRGRGPTLSVAPEGLRSRPTLAALSQHSMCLPDGTFWNTHNGLLASCILHTLFPPFRVWLTAALNRPRLQPP